LALAQLNLGGVIVLPQALGKPAAWLFIPLLLLLLVACGGSAPAAPAAPGVGADVPPAAAGSTPAAQPAPAEQPRVQPLAVDRLRIAIHPQNYEGGDPALDNITNMMTSFEFLVGASHLNGSLVPMLATEWEMLPGGRGWRLQLRDDVRWHRDYGDFTAADIAHTMTRFVREEAPGSRPAYMRRALNRVEVVNDYEVIIHLNEVALDFPTSLSPYEFMGISSKAQFDAEGQQRFFDMPAGTGPYEFVGRRLGESVSFERVSYQHWRVQPDFPEVEFIIAPETVTRQAMLLAGEIHIAEDIPMELHAESVARGMAVIQANLPSGGYIGQFGGNYLPHLPEYNADNPLVKKQVRQAMNLAINRQELVDTLFQGKFDQVVAPFAHPSHPEYRVEWEEKYREMYRYDPQRARELLAEAGYPNGFKQPVILQTQRGAPRQDDVAEAVASYWDAIGIETEIQTIEAARHTSLRRSRQTVGQAWVQQAVWRPIWNRVQVFNSTDGAFYGFESEFIEDRWGRYKEADDVETGIRLIQDIVEHLMDEYAHFPLMWVIPDFMVNPRVVAEYETIGLSGPSNVEYIKATR
jgi:peptide/nickel transport system substrate-binding protein